MVKRLVYSFCLLFGGHLISNAQKVSYEGNLGADALFFGAPGYGSVNLDYTALQYRILMLHARAGIGAYRFSDYKLDFNPDFLFPFGAYLSAGGSHRFETGVGLVVSNIVMADRETFEPVRTLDRSLYYTLGYRFQKPRSTRFFGRAHLNFLVESSSNTRLWAGFSIGYLIVRK